MGTLSFYFLLILICKLPIKKESPEIPTCQLAASQRELWKHKLVSPLKNKRFLSNSQQPVPLGMLASWPSEHTDSRITLLTKEELYCQV